MNEPKLCTQSSLELLAGYCLLTGYSVEEIRSRSRTKRLVEARRFVALRLREWGFSLTEVGNLLDRDHSTVMNLCKPGAKAAEPRLRVVA